MPSSSKHKFQSFEQIAENKNLIFSKNFNPLLYSHLHKTKHQKIAKFSIKFAGRAKYGGMIK